MIIDKLGRLDPLNNVQKPQRSEEKGSVSAGHDSIEISNEAKALAESMYLSEIAAGTPDVRMDRVAEVKEKIQSPTYLNESVVSSTADKIMESFGL